MTDPPKPSTASSGDREHDATPVRGDWVENKAVPDSVGVDRLTLTLESLPRLSGVRRQVRAFMVAGCGSADDVACEDAVERAVLVIDELTSNALRHGLAPSALHISDEPGRWLVVVRDSAPTRTPEPAVGRAAGQGGYGLCVIADLTDDHGVQYHDDHKLVWACLSKPAPSGSP